jgi:hypothetical protein
LWEVCCGRTTQSSKLLKMAMLGSSQDSSLHRTDVRQAICQKQFRQVSYRRLR